MKENHSVVCKNPATGQILETTAKLFDALYENKGFELVETDDDDYPATAPGGKSFRAGAGDIPADANILCKDPTSGQIMEVSAKLFFSLYEGKGFERVTRSNIEPDGRAHPAKPTTVRNGEPKSISTGSAAAVAAALKIDPNQTDDDAGANKSPDPATPETASGSKADETNAGTQTNELETDVDGSVDSGPREATKRDRGRSS